MTEHPALDPDAWSATITDHRVMVADGHQVKVTVRDGHLSVVDGVPGQLRERKLPKVPRNVTRLIILARRGYITLEALRWCQGANVTVSHICEEVTMTSGSHEGDARVIVAQTKPRIEVARYLLSEKVFNQGLVLEFALGEIITANTLRKLASDIRRAQDIPAIRTIEGTAASLYWGFWWTVELPWSPADALIVPEHWQKFPGRPSMLHDSRSARHATDPVNAMLNYAYKVLESEALTACRLYGLHPDLGMIHAHGTDRHAFALDLMEPVRPYCDELVLQYLDRPYEYDPGASEGHTSWTYFDKRWCHEERDGKVVLDPPLTHLISSWSANLGGRVQEYAKRVREMMNGEA